jgi:uncharacterized protein with FMN-binding domain
MAKKPDPSSRIADNKKAAFNYFFEERHEAGKVQKIVALPNQDTPSVFAQAETLLKKFVGKSVDEAEQMKVDGVSGATYSSKALIQNVKGGLKYYKENKK